ncbi:MAG: hypothetical protein IPN55_06935 [Saprospiraceae bacterium]|nr:hypothetical protein [Candidatus Brachybacter algidus]
MSISQGNILSFAKQLFLALIVYCFLILCLGYEFGSGDQTEFIPLLRDNILNGYFKKDFFVQNYLLSGHDVRHGVIATCDIGNRFLELNWWLFILHFLSGMVMILGGMAVLGHFTKNKALLVAALCIIWGILYGINLGSNEIYYAQLLPSLLAKSCLIWAIYFYIKNKITIWPAFVILGSYWQDMAAIQVFLLLTGSNFIVFFLPWLRRKVSFKNLFKQINPLPNFVFLGYVIIFIFLKSGLLTSNNTTDSKPLIDILMWRVGHHFDPALYPLRNYLTFGLVVIPSLFLIYKRNMRIFIFCILALTGCLIYALLYQVFPQIIMTQWFKTTIWVKLICFGALFIYTMEFIFLMFGKQRKLNVQAALLTGLLALGIYKGPLHDVPYQLPFTKAQTDDEVSIALLAREKTAKDALFLIPPDNSTFKVWSKRSCFIDYKSTVFDARVLEDWLSRITLVYGISLSDHGGLLAYPKMRARYKDFLQSPTNLNKIVVTHFITEEVLPQYTLLGEAGRWRLYKVK